MNIEKLSIEHAGEIARTLRESYNATYPDFKNLYSPQEDLAFVQKHLLPRYQVFGGSHQGRLFGFIAFKEGDLDQLYICPEFQRQGLGSKLLARAQSQCKHLVLWTYARNSRARQFYEDHGFTQINATQGDNEQAMPDVQYQWKAV